uniref:G-protein coupled receptors family 1 profile domain-containing protein n=1 Tax=Sinocyclocheilus rhinocerous TaxID=307959 RepID=A0A673LFN0_9TELE
MSDNTSLSSVSNASLPPPLLTDWTVPSFTPAAQARVAATLVLFLFTAVSNLALLISVSRGRGRRLASHLRPLIISLASADLMMTFIVMPLDMVWNVTVQWYAGAGLCKLLCFLKLFAMQTSAFILVVISLDRHHAILRPLDSLNAHHRNRRMLLLAWSLSALIASPQVTHIHTHTHTHTHVWSAILVGTLHRRNGFSTVQTPRFSKCHNAAVPKILLVTSISLKFIHFIPQRLNSLRRSGTDMIPKTRMKTLKMTIIIVLSFVVCWTPYYLLGIWYWFQPQMLKVTPEYIHHLLFVFGNLNTCCDLRPLHALVPRRSLTVIVCITTLFRHFWTGI